MARKKPPKRLSELAAAAADVFIRSGYLRAQMDDVAAALGVAKGTLYLYVESKEALFDLAVRFAAGDPVDAVADDALPLPSPPQAHTFARIADELGARSRLDRLVAALATDATTDLATEARAI